MGGLVARSPERDGTDNMSLSAFLFWAVAAMTGLCAVGVVISQNIVRAAAWLLFTLAGTAGLFFLLGADFVAATQLLVYVGGTLVLVVFGVMLTAQGPFITMKTSATEWAVSALVGGILLAVLVVSTLNATWPKQTTKERDPETSSDVMVAGKGFSGLPTGPEQHDQKKTPVARTSYLLPFEIVSVHLLVVLIGAAYLARAKRRRGAAS